jgi:predicted HicB family RNase H-like nuclease
MKETMKYKGYFGSITASIADGCLHGKILFINDLVTYQAEGVPQLKVEFEAAVDDYLATCAQLGIEPKKPFNGSFNVRIGSSLHEQATLLATTEGRFLNDLVCEAVQGYVRHAGEDQGKKKK